MIVDEKKVSFLSRTKVSQLSMFLNKSGPIWSTVRLFTDQMNDEKMNYAVIGWVAIYTHGYEETTNGCDILLAWSVYRFD